MDTNGAHDAFPDTQPAVLMPEFMVLRQPAAGWVQPTESAA